MRDIYAYLITVLLLLGGGAFLGWHFTASHYQRVIAADKADQELALGKAKDDVIAAQRTQAAAKDQAEKTYANLMAGSAATTGALLGRVRQLEAALSARRVPATVDHPAEPGGAAAESGSVGETPSGFRPPGGSIGAIDALNLAINGAIVACQADAAELAAILEMAPR